MVGILHYRQMLSHLNYQGSLAMVMAEKCKRFGKQVWGSLSESEYPSLYCSGHPSFSMQTLVPVSQGVCML